MTWYLWIKAAHVIAMVCWFAGLFYLPRLFIYHLGVEDEAGRRRFATMESKLYRIIMNPSMAATLVFGIWALLETWSVYAGTFWLWLKVALVIGLLGHHHYCLYIMRALAAGRNTKSERFLRVFNEIPALALAAIVVLVIVKPF